MRLLILGFCAFLVACGSTDRQTAVLKPEFVNPTPTVGFAESRAQVAEEDPCNGAPSLDDLGFVRLPDGCSTLEIDPNAPVYATLAEYVGQPEAIDLAAMVRDRLVMQTGCLPLDERAPRSVLVERLLEALPDQAIREAVRTGFVTAAEADTHCNVDQAAWTRASLRTVDQFLRVGELLDEVTARVERPAADCCDADVTAVTSLLAMASDEIYATLRVRPDKQASEFWDSYAHLHHVRTMSAFAADETKTISTIVLGSSVVARGIEAAVLPETYNLGMQGTHQPHAVYTAEAALRLHPGIDTIVWGQQSSEMFGCIDRISDNQRALLERRNNAFAPVVWTAGFPADDILLGTGTAAPKYQGTKLDAAAIEAYSRYEAGDLSPPGEGPKQEAVDERLETAVDWWTAEKQLCQSRIDIALNAGAEWVASGRRVVLVFWPLSPTIRSLHPDGPELHDRILDDVRAQAEAKGIEVLNLSTLLPDEDFLDLTHLDLSGLNDVTAAVGSYLSEGAA